MYKSTQNGKFAKLRSCEVKVFYRLMMDNLLCSILVPNPSQFALSIAESVGSFAGSAVAGTGTAGMSCTKLEAESMKMSYIILKRDLWHWHTIDILSLAQTRQAFIWYDTDYRNIMCKINSTCLPPEFVSSRTLFSVEDH